MAGGSLRKNLVWQIASKFVGQSGWVDCRWGNGCGVRRGKRLSPFFLFAVTTVPPSEF